MVSVTRCVRAWCGCGRRLADGDGSGPLAQRGLSVRGCWRTQNAAGLPVSCCCLPLFPNPCVHVQSLSGCMVSWHRFHRHLLGAAKLQICLMILQLNAMRLAGLAAAVAVVFCRRMAPILQGPPHPNPMPWGPFRPRQPIMPPHIIGGDYDRFPNVALGGAGLFGGLPGGLGGVGFSGGGVNLGFGGGGVAGLGPGSGGAMFSGGGGALGQAGPMPAGFGGGVAGVPRSGGGRRGNSCSNTRLC
jgi:hypothetical protein